MELEEFKASHFDNINELIETCKMWIKDDDYDAYCRFFDMGAMEELIKEITRIKEESIPRAAVKKIETYCKQELAFERRLKKENRTPDEFNQGRFYTCENILEILNKGEENAQNNKSNNNSSTND